MPQGTKKRKRRIVVDTNVLVAGISGFREQYIPDKNPSADLLHKWAETDNFVWPKDFPQEFLKAKVVSPSKFFA